MKGLMLTASEDLVECLWVSTVNKDLRYGGRFERSALWTIKQFVAWLVAGEVIWAQAWYGHILECLFMAQAREL